jgi:hypothetical protein
MGLMRRASQQFHWEPTAMPISTGSSAAEFAQAQEHPQGTERAQDFGGEIRAYDRR